MFYIPEQNDNKSASPGTLLNVLFLETPLENVKDSSSAKSPIRETMTTIEKLPVSLKSLQNS